MMRGQFSKRRRIMKLMKLTFVLTLVALAVASIAFAQHGHHGGEAVTVKGEVIDTACYMKHPESAVGEDHRECALMCTRKGIAMSVLDAEGNLFLMVPDHSDEKAYDQLKEWAADQVEVTGTMTEQGGLKALIVASAKKLSD